ncbi:hypothetical protein ASG03_10035 [Rhizobium sp. Leaf341]|nr:hypothetical protein ASG03_10035 [Rhizobium sp. Leaf341]
MRTALIALALTLVGTTGHTAPRWAEIQQCVYECTQGGQDQGKSPRGSSQQCKAECERQAEEDDG